MILSVLSKFFSCLVAAEEDGVLKHTSASSDGQLERLSVQEANRVIKHSKKTEAYYNAIRARVDAKTKGCSFGAVLTRFADDLRRGSAGAAANRQGRDDERKRKKLNVSHSLTGMGKFNDPQLSYRTDYASAAQASIEAYEGYIFFMDWVRTLNSDDLTILNTVSIKGKRLTIPSILAKIHDCTSTASDNIESIVFHNEWLYDHYPSKSERTEQASFAQLSNGVHEAKRQFIEAIRCNDYIVKSSYGENESQQNLYRNLAASIKSITQLKTFCLSSTIDDLLMILPYVDDFPGLETQNPSDFVYRELNFIYMGRQRDTLINFYEEKIRAKNTGTLNDLLKNLNIIVPNNQLFFLRCLKSRFDEFFQTPEQFLSVLKHPKQMNSEWLLREVCLHSSLFQAVDAFIVVNRQLSQATEKKILLDTNPLNIPSEEAQIQNFNQLILFLEFKLSTATIKEKIQFLERQGDKLKEFFNDFSFVEKFLNLHESEINSALLFNLGSHTYNMVNTSKKLEHVIKHTTTWSHPKFITCLEQQIKEFSPCADDYDEIFRILDRSGKNALLGVLDSDLPTSLNQGDYVILKLRWLPAGDEEKFIKSLEDKLSQMIKDNHLKKFVSVVPRTMEPIKCVEEKLAQLVQSSELFIEYAPLNEKYQDGLLDACLPCIAEWIQQPGNLLPILDSLLLHNRDRLVNYLIEKNCPIELPKTITPFLKLIQYCSAALRWKLIQYLAKQSPHLSQYVKTADGLIRLLEVCPQEYHKKLLDLMQEKLSCFIRTRYELDKVANTLENESKENAEYLMQLLGNHLPKILLDKTAKPKVPKQLPGIHLFLPKNPNETNRNALAGEKVDSTAGGFRTFPFGPK